MKTDYTYLQRTSAERFRGEKEIHKRTWLCDNPKCNKVYHFSSYCPNTVPSLLSKWWYRLVNKLI